MTPTSSPYAQIWRLGAGSTHYSALQRTERPQAAALMRELELDHLEADSSIDRQLHQLMQLHQEGGDQRSALARLCLRCRASGVAASHLKALVTNYRKLSRRALQPEVEELASFILDDKGDLLPDGASAHQSHEPFLLWVVRGWDPDRGSLPTWVKTAINGHNGIKKLEAHYGICRISTWAILAHRVSEKAIRDHWSFLGDGDMKPEEAINLLRDYQRHYPQVIKDYRARTGRRNGWLPGDDFLRQVNPHEVCTKTLAKLKAIADFWRALTFGPKQTSIEDPPPTTDGTARRPPALPNDGGGSDEATPDLLQHLASEEDARLVLAQVESVRRTLWDSITSSPSYKPLRQRLRANGGRLLCACRGQAEGRRFGDEEEGNRGEGQRNQREIANECGCSQPTIQRDIKLLETWAEEIALEAAGLLKTTPGFEKLGTSATLIDAVAAALCELLLKPLNHGEQALLCQAIDHHIHSS